MTFTVPLKDQVVTEKDSVTLECEVSKPDQKVVFLKNGKPIKLDNKRIKQVSEGTVHKLIIDESVLDDTAEYTAKLGDQTTKGKLTVDKAKTKGTIPKCYILD